MTDQPEAFVISYWAKRVTVEHRLAGGNLTWSTKAERYTVPCVCHSLGSTVCVYAFDKGQGKTLVHALLVVDWASHEAFYAGFPAESAPLNGKVDIDRGAVQSKYWMAAASAFPRSDPNPGSEQTPSDRLFTSSSGTRVELHSGPTSPLLMVNSADGSTRSFLFPISSGHSSPPSSE